MSYIPQVYKLLFARMYISMGKIEIIYIYMYIYIYINGLRIHLSALSKTSFLFLQEQSLSDRKFYRLTLEVTWDFTRSLVNLNDVNWCIKWIRITDKQGHFWVKWVNLWSTLCLINAYYIETLTNRHKSDKFGVPNIHQNTQWSSYTRIWCISDYVLACINGIYCTLLL